MVSMFLWMVSVSCVGAEVMMVLILSELLVMMFDGDVTLMMLH